MTRQGWLIEVTTTEVGNRAAFRRHVVVDEPDWFQACRAAYALDPRGYFLSPVRRVDEDEMARLQVPAGGALVIAETC